MEDEYFRDRVSDIENVMGRILLNLSGDTHVDWDALPDDLILVANDFDPNTPIAESRGLAQALGMENSLIRYEGGGHTAFFAGIPCITEAIARYLIDLKVPPPGFSCPALPVEFSTSPGSRSAALSVSVWGSCPVGQLPGRK